MMKISEKRGTPMNSKISNSERNRTISDDRKYFSMGSDSDFPSELLSKLPSKLTSKLLLKTHFSL